MTAEADLKVVRSQPTLRELALDKVREAILTCRFKPGQRLIERELCSQLGVSRSIVREVLRHLEAEGIVESIPQKGPVVARPRTDQIAEIYQIRAMLESDAAANCARDPSPELIAELERALDAITAAYKADKPIAVISATSDFYRAIFVGGRKSIAMEIVQSLNARINQLRAMTISTPNRSKDGPRELKRIVDAIRRKNPELARQTCVSHIERAAKIAHDVLASQTQEPPSPK